MATPICQVTLTYVLAAGEHWDRLLKASGKSPASIKGDWNKWEEEDEEDEKPDNFDMSQLQNLQQFGGAGGMGGMPGMENVNFEDMAGDDFDVNGAGEDSDDEEAPAAEDAGKTES